MVVVLPQGEWEQRAEKKGEIMEKKRLSLGIKILCLVLIVIHILPVMASNLTGALRRLPDAKKIKIIESGKYENINSIAEFNERFKEKTDTNAVPRALVCIILVIGLLRLKKWAWLGLLMYSAYNVVIGIAWYLPFLNFDVLEEMAKHITYPPIWALPAIICLLRPKVKEQFNS